MVNNNNVVRNVRGAAIAPQAGSSLKEATGNTAAKPQNKSAAKKKTVSTSGKTQSSTSIGAPGQGMFVE